MRKPPMCSSLQISGQLFHDLTVAAGPATAKTSKLRDATDCADKETSVVKRFPPLSRCARLSPNDPTEPRREDGSGQPASSRQTRDAPRRWAPRSGSAIQHSSVKKSLIQLAPNFNREPREIHEKKAALSRELL